VLAKGNALSSNQSKVTKIIADDYPQKILAGLGVLFSRFIKILPNFSLVGSFGFFQSNLVLFFAQIVVFDLFFGGVYTGFYFTYLGFFGYWLLGRLAGNKIKRQVLMLPLASFLFFFISNLGVWWFWYERTLSGLMTCYVLALPFYRNTLLGDLFFGGIFIMIKMLARSMRLNKQHSYANSQ